MKPDTIPHLQARTACSPRLLQAQRVAGKNRILGGLVLAAALMVPYRLLAAPPVVDNANGASNVLSISAVLTGTLTSTGGVPTQVYAYWGDTDGGTAFGSWGHTVDLGTNTTGLLSVEVTPLVPNQMYYYRFYATNVDGEAWAPATTNFQTQASSGPLAVDLGESGHFTLLAGSAITSAGGDIYGDAGVSPAAGSTIGLEPAQMKDGIIYATVAGGPAGSVVDPVMLTAAQNDLTTAYNYAAGLPPGTGSFLNPGFPPGNIGGMNLVPGVYTFDTSTDALIAGADLTLTGGPDDVWVFQMGRALIVEAGVNRSVILAGGAQADNVFWQVSSSAEIGTYSDFKGTIMADQHIVLDVGSKLEGRALARIAHVVFDGGIAKIPTQAAPPGLTNVTLTIISAHGAGTPLAGLPPLGVVYTNDYGALLTNSITAVETLPSGSTQYVSVGWSMAGNRPLSGVTNSMSMIHTNDAVLTWLWTTNYLLTASAVGNGAVTGDTNGFYAADTNVTLSATPDVGYGFDGWEVNGIAFGVGDPLIVNMSEAKNVIAFFSTRFIDVSSNVLWNVTWVFNPRLGYFLGTLTITNTSTKPLTAPFWFEVESTTNHWLRFPTGVDTNTGMDYLDITGDITGQLPGIGDGDMALDPGESVTVTGIELMGRREPANVLIMALWADPPGTLASPIDSDGDGVSDADEYIAGTNATDPDSVFRIRLGPDRRSVQWDSQPGRIYKVLISDDLRQGFTAIADTIEGTGTQKTYTPAPQTLNSGRGSVFYRVEATVK